MENDPGGRSLSPPPRGSDGDCVSRYPESQVCLDSSNSPFQPGGGWGVVGVYSWEMGDPEHGAHS